MRYASDYIVNYRTITGIQHPIRQVIYKAGRGKWVLGILCNGIMEQSDTFKTRREAFHFAGLYDRKKIP